MQPKLFGAFKFYFYPPPAVSKLNGVRARISKKNGAQICTDLTIEVTHILVAKGYADSEFWKLIHKLNPTGSILSSEWCSACIDENSLVSTDEFSVTEKEPENDPENEPENEPEKHMESPVKKAKLSYDYDTDLIDKRELVLETLNKIKLIRTASNHNYSAKMFDNAINKIKSGPPIYSGSDVEGIVSPKMKELVDEICRTQLSMLIPGNNEFNDVTSLFCTVYGIGPYTAKIFYEKGYRTLKDILPVVDVNGKVSIAHHEDFVERMSRTEVAEHFNQLVQISKKIDNDLDLECMGSFRRGKPDCGDIDIIFTKPKTDLQSLAQLFNQVLNLMFNRQFATHTFSQHHDRWLGSTQVIGKWRRMDILLVPSNEIGAAQLYYTGSGEFNRQLRLLARKQGMLLNHNGLFTSSGELLESQSEKRIFNKLNVEYLEPNKRNSLS